ncbi:MAG: hypothetical protein ACE5IY_04410 [bacterium]
MATNSKTLSGNRLQHNAFFRLYKRTIIDSLVIVRNHGFKELWRRKGWRFLLVIVLYYLVRDTIIYIVIPFLIAKGVME